MRHRSILAGLVLAVSALACSAPAEAGGNGPLVRQLTDYRQRFMSEQAFGERAATVRRSPRIVGGYPAPDGKWPFHVALVLREISDNYESQYCSGVLIHERFVLTVAHCVDFLRTWQLRILTGTQNLAEGGTRRWVRKITIHPAYDPNTFDSDIAVIELVEPATGIPVARMVSPRQESRFAGPRTVARLTGWGDTDPDDPDLACCYPTKLQQVALAIQPHADCNDADSYDGAITRNMICAGRDRGGVGACLADAGGPLVVAHPVSGRERWIAGLAAATGDYRCGDPEAFTVFTRISRFAGWVNDVIEEALP
jgi:secreted trypsin-like serine protease